VRDAQDKPRQLETQIPTPLDDLRSVCSDIFNRWDKDMRSGKLLLALSGDLQTYDPRVDRVRARLAAPDVLNTEGRT
jgi:hypothetical protein